MSGYSETVYNNSYGGPVTEINCVYPISGTYGLLPRLLYYVTLIFAIFGRRTEWLIIGALVSALTYAGTTAIHLMALVSSKSGVFDLDIMGAWAVLSTGALAYIGIIHWSSTLRATRARVVMICWGCLVGTSLIFGRSELFDTPINPPEPACYSSKGMLLEYPSQKWMNPDFANCTYQCFNISKPMRQSSEIMAIPHRILDNSQYRTLTYVLVGPIQFAAYAALSMDAQEHTPSHMCTRLVMSYLIHPGHREQFAKTVYKASMEQWYGGYFALLGYVRRSKWSWRKLALSSFVIPWMLLGLVIDVLCLPLMVCNIVFNELTLLQGGLPTNEANMAIGQWGAIVNSVLVLIAACITKGMEIWDRRKKAKQLDSVVEAVVAVIPEDVESGMAEEVQEVGVVKPKLAHVQTLQDMEDVMKRPK
ncbi:uncharacterized protein A1O5_06346 [Cladophialophora psammophila CBS 110553]|uniref:Uncharacterized protein n=1 Tax=Cladophialophora psammophila CBS 110553 TaxID=1182543 RepID=W9WQS9_9EURO|nr:uncharacterized protein A1O5_06346 [Cladophialophora psammophila CBS 110553]EXJ70278.1 hypothetical protein A1O5_06346 [Cladophialophora psammophila CBS 110553]